jgi:N-acetylneuraminate synthase
LLREIDMEFPKVKVGDRWVGAGEPVFVVAEIGINHNGDLQVAKRLIDGAVQAGADAVKFQKRTPELCVPRDQWQVMRETPWGRMSYIDYRHRVEFGYREYAALDIYCKERGILWFASCWDEQAYEFMEAFEPPCYKAASASLTDLELLCRMRSSGRPLFLSSGMSTLEQVREAVNAIGTQRLLLAHSESSYPCPVEQLNLRVIQTLQSVFPSIPIGYSGHETGLATTWAAVALGATHVERHITLDRAMWGSDQAASIEIPGFIRLVEKIRDIEKALGDGVKRVSESELRALAKLRRVAGTGPESELAAVKGAA